MELGIGEELLHLSSPILKDLLLIYERIKLKVLDLTPIPIHSASKYQIV